MKISYVLEWENAEGLELEEALRFLDNLCTRIAEFHENPLKNEKSLTIVFEGVPDSKNLVRISEKCKSFFEKENLTLLHTDDVPYYAKKMVAALRSDADIVVFCDSDCVYTDAWPEALINPISDNRAAVTFGQTFALVGDTLIERASTLA